MADQVTKIFDVDEIIKNLLKGIVYGRRNTQHIV